MKHLAAVILDLVLLQKYLIRVLYANINISLIFPKSILIALGCPKCAIGSSSWVWAWCLLIEISLVLHLSTFLY